MKTSRIALLIGLAVLAALSLASTSGRAIAPQAPAPTPARDYPVQPVPFTAVHLDDGFWAPRIETNRQVTIPFAFQQCELSGRVDNFERAAAALRGETLANTKPPGRPPDYRAWVWSSCTGSRARSGTCRSPSSCSTNGDRTRVRRQTRGD